MEIKITNLIAVFLGGGIGSVMRYAIGKGMGMIVQFSFPWNTFLINIMGSIAIGYFYSKWDYWY